MGCITLKNGSTVVGKNNGNVWGESDLQKRK
jgi:hypothetical protein